MSDEAALLRAICDHPDDDTPRLVFADWLTEQGGPVNGAWANAIRVQIWDAQGLPDHPLKGRPLLFDSAYGKRLFFKRIGADADTFDWERWDRGFPTTAHGTFADLRTAWPRVAHRVPVRRVLAFEMSEAAVAEFVAWPGLNPVRELEIVAAWGQRAGLDLLPPLAGCASFGGLRSLTVREADVSDESVLAVLDSPHLARLKHLQLYYYGPWPLSRPVAARLRARFGPNAIDDAIPF